MDWRAHALAARTGLIEQVLAPGSRVTIANMLEQHMPGSGAVLDVGCGPRPHVLRPGQIGLDADPAAVAAYRRHAAAMVGDASRLPFASGHFKAVISVGLLHHLSEESAKLALAEMKRVTAQGGTICVVDGILPSDPWRTPLAALIRRLDFGSHMRSAPALETMFERTGPWRITLVRYASTGLEGMLAVYKKP